MRSGKPSRLRWLFLASLIAHLALTPLAAWIGLPGTLWQQAELPSEEQETLPIELLGALDSESVAQSQPLPEEKPVGLIEEALPNPGGLQRRQEPAEAKSEPVLEAIPMAPALRPLVPVPTPEVRASPLATRPSASVERDAVPSPTVVAPSLSARAESSAVPSSTVAPSPSAGIEGSAVPSSIVAVVPSPSAEPPTIEGPSEAVGAAFGIVKEQAYVSITLHAARIRDHVVGLRVARLLPSLSQWNDFFPDGGLNPVSDFDHLVIVGPSLVNPENFVVLLQYNIDPGRVHAAIGSLVKRGGAWLTDTNVPTALAQTARVPRVLVMSSPGLVAVAPPAKKDEILDAKGLAIPQAKGLEAMVVTLVQPWKLLARYNIALPKSVRDIELRLTTLAKGEVKIELQAEDESPERAELAATQMNQTINGILDLATGLGGLLELSSSTSSTVVLPRLQLVARGKFIWGEQILTSGQVEFLLTQLETQALLWSGGRESAPSTSMGSLQRGSR